jgi:hypothetical protein
MKSQVALMGGLGNQLFQLAAGLCISLENGNVLELNPNLSNCRKNMNGEPEILSYSLPRSVVTLEENLSKYWLGKLFGHSRKIQATPVGFEANISYQAVIGFLVRSQTRKLLGRNGQVIFFSEVGYVEIPKGLKNAIYFGYFQSYKYLSNNRILIQMMELTSDEYPEVQEFYKTLSLNTSPLVVHVRLGDYRTESNFGLVSKKYYSEAIKSQMETNQFDSIWLFSDEPDEAVTVVPPEYISKIRVVTECANSSAATLEIMRLGKGYVIANSTFSWWGAILSHTHNPKVISPDPWFRGMSEPKDLIPPDWIRFKS